MPDEKFHETYKDTSDATGNKIFPKEKKDFPRFPVFILGSFLLFPALSSCVGGGGEKGEFLLFRTMMQEWMGEGKNGNPGGEDAFRRC